MSSDANILDDFSTRRLAELERKGVVNSISTEIGLLQRAVDQLIGAAENRIIEHILISRVKKALRASGSQTDVEAVTRHFRSAYDDGRMETLPSFFPAGLGAAQGFADSSRRPAPDPRHKAGPRQPKIIYTPGGGFVLPPSKKQKLMVQRLADATGCEVILGTHRLAPEHPFPAAIHDVAAQFEQVVGPGDHDTPVFLAADTAGASIALGALQLLVENNGPLPAGLLLFSPWCDLSLSGWSYITGSVGAHSPFRMETAAFCARLYLQGNSPTNPLVSAIYADPKGWPPLLIQTSQHDLHLDDAIRIAENYEARKLHIQINYWDTPRHHLERFSARDAMRYFAEVSAFIDDVARDRQN